ncbi:MAG: 6,7-dimethyl-8-ribityllumazine synthase [Acidimicrobiales bacterium]|nr:MAG: 6,7-dimethyl-8-ribityllumazine synthase [Acidimicrobiales bacterium]
MSSDPASQHRPSASAIPAGATYLGQPRGEGLRVALACSRFNGAITERLLTGAWDGLIGHGVDRASVTVAWAPGAFELPLVAARLAGSGQVDAVVCLGAVIRGATGHYDQVAGQCAAGIQRAQLDAGVPVILGVLTTDTLDQALERSATEGVTEGTDKRANKGFEAALAAIEMADLLRQLPAPGVPAAAGLPQAERSSTAVR